MMRRCSWMLLALTACGSGTEPLPLTRLGLRVAKNQDASTEIACDPLPLLQGSRRQTRFVVEKELTITVVATPESASVRFADGQRLLEEDRIVLREALETEYREDISLRLEDGSSYTVTLTSECAP